MDWLFALGFFVWFELLSLPLRVALSAAPMPLAVRRVLTRVAGPLVLVLPVWWLGHFMAIDAAMGVIGTLALGASAGGVWSARRRGLGLAQIMAYSPAAHSGSGWRRWGGELAYEGLTLALFFAFVAFRRWVPEMTFEVAASAAEKFANAMIYNACLNAPALPPDDYWFSGHALTYYYFGHFHWAAVARSAAWWGLPAAFTLNLALARLTVATFEATWLLARAAGVRSAWAALAGLGAAWAGNLAAVTQVWNQWRAGVAVGYPFDPAAFSFWDASRAIKNVVDEFPAFSAILGDFHAHHLALPWLLAWLAIGIAGLRWLRLERPAALENALAPKPLQPVNFGLAAVWITLGVASIIGNFWYLPCVLVVTPLVVFLRARLNIRGLANALILILVFAICVKFSIMLQRGSESVPLQPGNIDLPLVRNLPLRIVPAELRSTTQELIAMWGLPGIFLSMAILLYRRRPARILNGCFLTLLMGIQTVLCLKGIAFSSGLLWGYWFLLAGPLNRRTRMLATGAFATLIALEIFYVPDRFVGELARYNSYFKFSYAVWPVLWVIAAQLGARLWNMPQPLRRWPARAALVLLFAASAVYTPLALTARIVQAQRGDLEARTPTLDYAAFVANRQGYALEAPLLAAIRERVPAGECVIEAALPMPYNYGGRVASLAGRPVPIGWDHHEQQWRGEPAFGPLADRRAQVEAFYRARDPIAMRSAARALGARWAVYGKLEEERYGPAALATLRRAAKPVAGIPGGSPRYFLFAFPVGD